jgi:uncharacterized membrane protein YoaT (DUF817 family)
VNSKRLSYAYTAALVGLIAIVALARFDLVIGAFEMTLAGFRRGPAAQAHLIFEIALLAGILLLTLRAVPMKVAPKRDALIFALAALAGYAAEAWGTQTGLWTYYTREAPPLWIVPVWPLGALVIDRMSEYAKQRWKKYLSNETVSFLYWGVAVSSISVFLLFAGPAEKNPMTWLLLVFMAGTFCFRPEPKRDIWIVLTGLFYVFFADIWGTTNNCWTYYHQGGGSALRLLSGVGFGMFFDSTLILGTLKLARFFRAGQPE